MTIAFTIVQSIFLGFSTLVPLLLVYKWLKLKVIPVSIPALVDSANTALLLGAVPVLLFLIFAFGVRYYHDVPFSKFTTGNPIEIVQFWLLIFTVALLPQIMWVESIRTSSAGSLIFIVFVLVSLLINSVTKEPIKQPIKDVFVGMIIFSGVVTLIYIVKTK